MCQPRVQEPDNPSYSFMKFVCLFLLLINLASGSGNLIFEETIVGVVARPEEDFVHVKFPFTVHGEQEAVIKKFEAPCNCLNAKIGEDDRKIWQPGEKSYVTGTFEIGTFRGTVEKHIHIAMGNGKTHQLTVAMTTPKLITINPKELKWQAGSEPEEKLLKITLDPSYPVNIKSIINSNPKQFDFQLETIKEGKDYQLRITPKSTKSRALGSIRIATDSKTKRHKAYQAFMVVEQTGLAPNKLKK